MSNGTALFDQFVRYANYETEITAQLTDDTIHDLDHAILNCIHCIGTLEEPSVTLISEKLKVSCGTASKMVKKLYDLGYAAGTQVQEDRRRVLLHLTDAGQEIFQLHLERHSRWDRIAISYFDTLPPESRDQAIAFMSDFNSYLHQYLDTLVYGPGAAGQPELIDKPLVKTAK